MPHGDALVLMLHALPAGDRRRRRVQAAQGSSRVPRHAEGNRDGRAADRVDDRKWKPDDYKDEFRAQLRQIIDEQIARQTGKKVRARKQDEAAPADGDRPTSSISWSC